MFLLYILDILVVLIVVGGLLVATSSLIGLVIGFSDYMGGCLSKKDYRNIVIFTIIYNPIFYSFLLIVFNNYVFEKGWSYTYG